MRQKFPLLFAGILVLIAAVVVATFVLNKNGEHGGTCTLEAKLCPDGSAVGRTGTNCEFAKCPGEENGGATGTVAGRVHIGPLCPVEPCPVQVPNPYIARQIVFEAQGKPAIYFSMNPDGTFEANVTAGTYTVTITDCQYMGCRYGLPKTVVVEANKTKNVEIDIDTGIR